MEKTAAFYRRFQQLCDKNGRSPTGVVTAAGLSSCLVTAWKRGASPKLDTIARMAKELNVSVTELMEDNTEERG